MAHTTRWDAAAGDAAVERLLAGEPAEAVLDPGAPDCWTAFDAAVRAYGRHTYGAAALEARARLRAVPETALCHPDGRVREAALADGPRTTAFWPLAVVRCTDWAEPVRARARALVAELLRSEPGRTLRLLTPLVLRLARRQEGAWARDLVLSALTASPAAAYRLLGPERDAATRRLAARVLTASGLPDPLELARLASTEPDPMAARLFADGALAGAETRGAAPAVPDAAQPVPGAPGRVVGPGDAPRAGGGAEGRAVGAGVSPRRADRADAVDLLLGARVPAVRSAGVTALRRAERGGEAVAYLADRSGLVRACARWVVAQGGGDARARTLALCADPAAHPWALVGLAECGRREDAPLLRALLAHPDAAVRARAVAGLRLLESVRVADVLPLLDDTGPGVAREAVRALLPYAGALPGERLLGRLDPRRPAPLRRAAFRLLRARGGLCELRAAVAVLDDPDTRLRRCGEAAVQGRRWLDEVPRRSPEVDALVRRTGHLFSDYVMAVMRDRLGLPRITTDPTGG
ncbi:hypothetical protein [Streptomyces sp. NPDC005805]|uniref:hypothetical protein n=1 Tax=Streptomyces sp. NPDC005805 TaxID=3157068 RepID=UPI0033F810CB